MGFLWFLGGFVTAIFLLGLLFAVFCAGMAAADKKKPKPEAPDVALYNDMEVE